MRYLFLAGLLLAAMPVAAEPLNYDYIYLSSGRIEPEQGESRNASAFGAFYSFANNFHGFIGVDDGGAYAASAPADADIRNWRIGAGGHFLVSENVMLAPAAALLRGTVEYRACIPLGPNLPACSWTDMEASDTGYVVQLDARWNFAERWEVIGGLHRSELFEESETEIVAGILWHPTDWLALGAMAKDRDTSSIAELTGRWYF
ncbi:MAG: hypothetical protein R3270_03385 [Gammaproteobacteria bacterium]|nr:hypothetical protein [Gammaproteobacteria bacterium]